METLKGSASSSLIQPIIPDLNSSAPQEDEGRLGTMKIYNKLWPFFKIYYKLSVFLKKWFNSYFLKKFIK